MTTKYTTSANKVSHEDIYDSNNHIKVIWEDTLDNHSAAREKEIEKYFQNKYKTNKVKVIFKPIANKNSDVVVEGTADASELVLDEAYQKALIEKYIEDNKINVSLPALMKLDTSVNVELENYKEQTSRYKTFKIEEIEFSNFLSYGDGNKITFSEKGGITSVISDPPNYGGKTTLTVDLLLFLFFGTTTKTDKNEEVFNRFTDSDTVQVKGKVNIEGDTYIIDRKINRKKSKDGFTYKGEVDFYQVLPRGGVRQLNGEQRKFTDELIKTYVGTYDDFLITILTTGDNLDDLIKTKPTERGRILTRFIGLEFFREKEKIAKEKYAEWKQKSKMHHNNTQEIMGRIDAEKEKINQNNQMLGVQKKSENEFKDQIAELNTKKESLFKSRFNDIDTELYKLDESTIQEGIDKVSKMISAKKEEITNLEKRVPKPKNEYDIDEYGVLKLQLKEKNEAEVSLRMDISSLSKTIDNLTNNQICQSCKRPLDNIEEIKKEIADAEKNKVKADKAWDIVKSEISEINDKIAQMDTLKNLWDEYNRNILLIDKATLELNSYNDSLQRGTDKLNQYHKIKEMVQKNKLIDTEIQTLKYKIESLEEQKNMVSLRIRSIEKDNELSENRIKEYNDLILELKKEEVVDKIFNVYLDIYGKNGISKMVLGSMIPLINSHLKILLSDSCEFILEIRMNEKNEVEFWMIDQESEVEKPLNSGSGYEKTVSSLALRCVLSKVCSLPKPNIIVFDEVTGKVSNENLDKVGLFFDKLKQFFDHIWIISHNPLIQDWANHCVKVRKEENISTII